jgi:hypothetical protein
MDAQPGAIGDPLFITPRTGQVELSDVLTKLDVSSRNRLDRPLETTRPFQQR